MFAGKPIIGIAGGIGGGKSLIARLFGEQGFLVLDADQHVRQVYTDPAVLKTLQDWWGGEVLDDHGQLNRKFIASKIFNDPAQRKRLEALVHPLVFAARQFAMQAAADDAQVIGYVWDIPLLFETGLNKQCDAVVFVDSTFDERLQRVQSHRGWDEAELRKREISQMPLDIKRKLANYIVQNTADVGFARNQVLEVLSKITPARSMGSTFTGKTGQSKPR